MAKICDVIISGKPEKKDLIAEYILLQTIVIAGLVSLFLLIISLLDKDFQTTKAIKVILYSNYDEYDSKDIIIFSGLIAGSIVLVIYYFYLSVFINNIWNKYYASEPDKALSYVFIIFKIILLAWFMFKPHYWYVFLAVTYITFTAFLYFKYYLVKRGFRRMGIKIKGGDIIFDIPFENIDNKDHLKTRVTFLRSIFRNFLWTGVVYCIPFYTLIISSHVLRGDTGSKEFDMFFAGIYAASSFLFAILVLISLVIRGISMAPSIKYRIEINDEAYFIPFFR